MAKIPEFNEDMDIIAALGDVPGTDDNLSPAGLKAKFDRAGNLLKKYLNTHVVPAINGYIASNDGMLSRQGGQMNGAIDMFGNEIKNLPLPTEDGDAVSKKFIDTVYDPEIKRYVDDLGLVTAEHRRSGTLHVLTAPAGCGNLKFTAVAPFEEGDTITLNGVAVVPKTQDGEALTGGAWAAGAVVMCLVSQDGGTLFFKGGGGGVGKSEIIVTAPTGSTVTATCGSITKTASEKNGKLILHGLELGAWTIKVDLAGSDRMALLVSLTRPSIKYVTFDFTTGEAYVDQSSLVVKTRAGSTVTVSNWSATYTTLAIDGEATFEDLELGEWTITALHPEQKNPAEESISLVRPEIVYIELNYELYLYKAGDECIDVTGGWTSIAKNSSSSAAASPRAPDVTRNPSSINIKLPKGTEGYSGIFCATKSVDLTRYSTLRAYGTFINGLSEKNDTFAMYVWSNLGKFFKDNVVGATMIEIGTNTYEVRLPIDAMSGEHYIGFGLNTRMGAMEMTITEITIE